MPETKTTAGTITATLHKYYFDISKPEDNAAHKALKKQLLATPGRGHWMNASNSGGGERRSKLYAGPIDLNTDQLFHNQWNTACGNRIFDWFEEYPTPHMNQDIRRGHYLDITPEIVAARADRLACGYCGKQRDKSEKTENGLCDKCIGSEYLEPENWHLLRLQSMAEDRGRAEFTADELAKFRADFTNAQVNGLAERTKAQAKLDLAKINERLIEAGEKHEQAKKEHAARLALIDLGLNPTEPIFYNHTGLFCWGWRSPCSDAQVSAILEVIAEWPHRYEIITQPGGEHDGRKLTG